MVHLLFPIALLAFIVIIFGAFISSRAAAPLYIEGDERKKVRGRDGLIMLCITACYALSAFLNLGNTYGPESFCRFGERGQYALIELEQPEGVSAVAYFTGIHTGNYYVQFSEDGENFIDVGVLEQGYADLLKWKRLEIPGYGQNTRFVRLIADDEIWLGEISLYDLDGVEISADRLIIPDGCVPLFDERHTVPENSTYLNSSYFDEIYHVRTAFEHLEEVKPYEISHPPLGKLIISIGISIFGLNPFGWRFMGTLVGVLMLPLVYFFTKRMFGGTAVPALVTLLSATDFMHFAQTRIATIDSYSVFFILLMYLFMYIYLQSERSNKKWVLPLALSGISFGLGAASKWTCLYAGAGLGLIWFIDRVERYFAARAASEDAVERMRVMKNYWRETLSNVLVCLLFFVAVPVVIYYLSYYPYGQAEGMSGLGMFFRGDYFDIVIRNQEYMLSYHSGVDAEHPYSSRWWQWILNGRPILYYLEYSGNEKSTIGAFLNPFLCWGGLGAIISMLWLWVKEKDRTARFIFLGYLAQLLPWVFVTRITFEYHYFPSSVFLLLALGYVFDSLRRRFGGWKWLLGASAAVSIVLFAAFYPVLSGAWVSRDFAENCLGWFATWPF
ncbi:MAG: phospholipid carrier-dependent glycosyltransferase [Ruminococcaceae bacterium]|nr:phospholipid carrier-dependent glycosyltransferase [Oscillospiraceae bacterium]